jgi:hypothetical protein
VLGQRFAAALALAGIALAALAGSSSAAPPRMHAGGRVGGGESARIARYWTPARMRSTPPLDAPASGEPLAGASFAPIAEPTLAPYSVIGRLFILQGREQGYCSATAIDSPSRRLILTAAHCVNSGPQLIGGSVWSQYMEFVPAYSNGVAPFGAFVAHRGAGFVLPQWLTTGNPNFDVAAILTAPNAEGVNLADAVGGARIAVDVSRRQQFQTFGYPRPSDWMQGCESPYVGDDSRTYRIPGPPTIAIHCRWAPGASGGGWLIEGGTAIDGLTSYTMPDDGIHTFGPYFSRRNVGRLVAGL